MIIESNSREETYKVGIQLGKDAVSGQVYCIYGDLGVGKTIISQGVAAGLGITEVVNSPTFTIVKEYDEGRLPLYHFDVYRIGDVDEMDEVGYNEEILPDDYTRIDIEKDLNKGLDYRRITIEERHAHR